MRYHLRTLLIVLALGPPIIWWLTGPRTETISADAAGRIIVDGKYYGLANPGDRVSLKAPGRVYVNGKLREPIEPWMPR